MSACAWDRLANQLLPKNPFESSDVKVHSAYSRCLLRETQVSGRDQARVRLIGWLLVECPTKQGRLNIAELINLETDVVVVGQQWQDYIIRHCMSAPLAFLPAHVLDKVCTEMSRTSESASDVSDSSDDHIDWLAQPCSYERAKYLVCRSPDLSVRRYY
jgi:hypothetical protein